VTSTTSSSAPDASGPLRVVVTNTSRSWGGNEQYALQVAEGLARARHAVLFIWSHPVVGERVREARLPQARLHLRADGDLWGLSRLAGHLRRHRADIVLLTKWREYLLGGLAAKLAGSPGIVLRLGLHVRPQNDVKRRLIFALADRVIVNAEEIQEALLSRPWIRPQKVRYIPNGIDLDHFRPDVPGDGLRRRLGIPPLAPLIANVGALTPQKDHETLLRAFDLVRRRYPDAHLAMAGEGFLRPRLEDRVRRNGAASSVHLLGFQTDVRPLLAAADLFVLSSRNEGMARVLLEAMACGRPVVATDVSGTRACVQPDVNGLVVPPGRPAELAAAAIDLLADPQRRRRMGAAGRRLVEERFSAPAMLETTLREFLLLRTEARQRRP
jgi:glycosyltransferase involved in cell wall biosynthesis